MNRRIVGIVTENTDDEHADAIILKLRELGHIPVRISVSDIPLRAKFSLRFGDQPPVGKLVTDKHEVAIKDIYSIWWRRPGVNELPASLSRPERDFAKKELYHALHGLWSIMDCIWVSHPYHLARASLKLLQLRNASALGLRIPRTLLTSDAEEAWEFFEKCNKRVIFKVLAEPGIETIRNGPEPRMVYTTLLDEENFRRHLANVATLPCLFQEYVPKKAEYRLTFFGQRHFAGRIDSQAHEITSVDWRHYEVPVAVSAGTVPESVIASCFELMKLYKLNFSTMDLIETPEGEWVFLENNANGQWLWVQTKVPEFKMVDAMVSTLLGESCCV